MTRLRSTLHGLCLATLLATPTSALAQHGEDGHGEAAHGEAAHGEDGHGEDGHGEAAHGEAHAVELDLARLVGQLVNFALWAGILWYLMKDRLPAFLSSRRAGIVTELDEAKRLKDEAERKFAEYESRIANLDADLEQMRAEMQKGGLAERDKIVADASARSEKLRAEARFLVEQQMKQLREDLTREAIEAAIAAASKILVERTQAADQERLANEYLERIATQMTSPQQKDGPSA
jgi:F-type H+-transporting ATPase subunit b